MSYGSSNFGNIAYGELPSGFDHLTLHVAVSSAQFLPTGAAVVDFATIDNTVSFNSFAVKSLVAVDFTTLYSLKIASQFTEGYELITGVFRSQNAAVYDNAYKVGKWFSIFYEQTPPVVAQFCDEWFFMPHRTAVLSALYSDAVRVKAALIGVYQPCARIAASLAVPYAVNTSQVIQQWSWLYYDAGRVTASIGLPYTNAALLLSDAAITYNLGHTLSTSNTTNYSMNIVPVKAQITQKYGSKLVMQFSTRYQDSSLKQAFIARYGERLAALLTTRYADSKVMSSALTATYESSTASAFFTSRYDLRVSVTGQNALVYSLSAPATINLTPVTATL